jgi:hypothetical protein
VRCDCLVDIGGIVDNHISPKESLNIDGQLFHKYQQNNHISPKESLNINGQLFHQYQQNNHISPKESLNWPFCIQ